jgi:hypothetical protein
VAVGAEAKARRDDEADDDGHDEEHTGDRSDAPDRPGARTARNQNSALPVAGPRAGDRNGLHDHDLVYEPMRLERESRRRMERTAGGAFGHAEGECQCHGDEQVEGQTDEQDWPHVDP